MIVSLRWWFKWLVWATAVGDGCIAILGHKERTREQIPKVAIFVVYQRGGKVICLQGLLTFVVVNNGKEGEGYGWMRWTRVGSKEK